MDWKSIIGTVAPWIVTAQGGPLGAAALGPKIGNGFFMNLYGEFGQLTRDRWLMRTWGRWTGTLVEFNPAQVKAKRAQIRGLILSLSKEDKKAFGAIIGAKSLRALVTPAGRRSNPDHFALHRPKYCQHFVAGG
jgi:hypothetical protein